jgi:GNAT superfamily N-acetyltransferase
MTPRDVDAATAALLRGDWGDRRSWFEFVASHVQCDALVADDGGEIVGTGVGTRNGSVGWIGTVYVAPERRGAGLGRALTERVCEHLDAAGCRTLVLVATEAGLPLYERMGFGIVGRYATVEHDGVGPEGAGRPEVRGAGPSRTIVPFRPADVDDAAELDRAATGEDRGHLLAAFAGIPGGLAVRDADGRMRGFLVRAPWGAGATIAPDPEDARRILDARLRVAPVGHRVRAGVLASNEAGLAMLHRDGWTDAWTAPRMARGEPIVTPLSAIWGQFNHALG